MQVTDTVGIDAYEVRISSTQFLSRIGKKDFKNPNPLPERKSVTGLPFAKLQVGYSIWIDMDNCSYPAWVAARLSCMRYKKLYGAFEWAKHRGDDRKSGFKFLEIARVK